MKKLYFLLVIIFIQTNILAQNKLTKKADKQFARLEYVAASKSYLKLAENKNGDAYIYKQLGDCFYNIFNPAAAVTWYAKAIEENINIDAETYYHYSQMLKASGKYEEANKQMSKFATLSPNDQRAKAFIQNPNYLPKLLSKQKEFDVKALTSINSEQSDFGACLIGNDFYFASARNKQSKVYGWSNEPFLDIYKATYNVDGTTTYPLPLTDLNSKENDGPVTVSQDSKSMYFASESFKYKSFVKVANKDKVGQVNLFKSEILNGKWSSVVSLPINGNSYSCGNPFLSHDGKTLYFGSNMPGGVGGVDIWKIAINSDGTYGAPVNLGTKVNTEGDENFPTITEDGKVLYFASNGRQGLGGLDIFSYTIGSDIEAYNLGKPVNSERDDFAFSLYDSKNKGFFSSNRGGNDDIYQAIRVCALEINTTVKNAKSGQVLDNAKVAIVDENKNVIATEMTNEKGEVNFRVLCDKIYTMQVSKDGFEGNIYPIAAVSKTSKTNLNAGLNPIEVVVTENEIVLNPIYFEYDKSNITQEGAFELDKIVQVMNDKPTLIILCKSHTDLRGSDVYNKNLSERRVNATVQYIISKGINKERILGKGLGESEPKATCTLELCTEQEHQQNRRSEFLIVK